MLNFLNIHPVLHTREGGKEPEKTVWWKPPSESAHSDGTAWVLAGAQLQTQLQSQKVDAHPVRVSGQVQALYKPRWTHSWWIVMLKEGKIAMPWTAIALDATIALSQHVVT